MSSVGLARGQAKVDEAYIEGRVLELGTKALPRPSSVGDISISKAIRSENIQPPKYNVSFLKS